MQAESCRGGNGSNEWSAKDVCLLPVGFTVLVPKAEGIQLIARRKAAAVGAYKQQTADVVLTEQEWEEATLEQLC